MQIISLIGVIIAVVVFILLLFRNMNLVIAAIIATLIVILTGQLPVLETIQDTFMTSFSGFLKNYFVIFALSATFGRVMSDGGGAKRIAYAIYNLVQGNEKHQKLIAICFVPALYAVLTFAGISGFIAAFTVMPIASEVFKKVDVPWRFFGFGACASIATYMAAGSLQMCNIVTARICGTELTAGLALSIVALVVYFFMLVMVIRFELVNAVKNGEGFLPSGAAFLESEALTAAAVAEDNLPSTFFSWIPMIAVAFCSSFMKLNIVFCLLIGIVLCVLLFYKRFINIPQSITTGFTSSFGSIIGISATSAIIAVMKIAPGFGLITSGLTSLPPLYHGAALLVVSTFVTASNTSSLDTFGPEVFELFTSAGLTPGTAHRLMTISTFTGIPPHSSGIANAVTMSKLNYKAASAIYAKGGMISGAVTLIVCLILVRLGVIV